MDQGSWAITFVIVAWKQDLSAKKLIFTNLTDVTQLKKVVIKYDTKVWYHVCIPVQCIVPENFYKNGWDDKDINKALLEWSNGKNKNIIDRNQSKPM